MPPAVAAQHILLKGGDIDARTVAAEAIKTKIEAGETTFEAAAREFSECSSRAETPAGSLGTFGPGKLTLALALALTLRPGKLALAQALALTLGPGKLTLTLALTLTLTLKPLTLTLTKARWWRLSTLTSSTLREPCPRSHAPNRGALAKKRPTLLPGTHTVTRYASLLTATGDCELYPSVNPFCSLPLRSQPQPFSPPAFSLSPAATPPTPPLPLCWQIPHRRDRRRRNRVRHAPDQSQRAERQVRPDEDQDRRRLLSLDPNALVTTATRHNLIKRERCAARCTWRSRAVCGVRALRAVCVPTR